MKKACILLIVCIFFVLAGCSINQAETQNDIPLSDIKEIIPLIKKDSFSKAGITADVIDGEFTIEGTASSVWFYNLAGSKKSYPYGMIAGEKYYIDFKTTERVFLRIIQFDKENPDGKTILETRTGTRFTAPKDADGIIIRLHVANGATVQQTTVRPSVMRYDLYCKENGIPEDPGPMLTIIDDDGHVGFMRDLLPIIEEKQVSIATAVTTTRIGSEDKWMTWDQIVECQQRGAEVLCHTYNHQSDISELSEEDLVTQYQKAKDEMLAHGLHGADILVYNNVTGKEEKARAAAAQVFKCAIHSSGREINYIETVDPYYILRMPVELEPYYYDINLLKDLIDQAVSNGGWMVWIIHTSASSWDENAVQAIRESIDYALALDVPIVSAEYGYQKYIAKN